jgi:hypothetical protein
MANYLLSLFLVGAVVFVTFQIEGLLPPRIRELTIIERVRSGVLILTTTACVLVVWIAMQSRP